MEERLWWDYAFLILICVLGFGAIVSLIQPKCGELLKRIVLFPCLLPVSVFSTSLNIGQSICVATSSTEQIRNLKPIFLLVSGTGAG